MVPYENSRSCFRQVFLWVLNIKPHASEEEHDPFETSPCSPLSHSSIAKHRKKGAGEDSIACSEEHGDDGCQTAGVKGEGGDFEGGTEEDEGVDREGENRRGGEEVEEEGHLESVGEVGRGEPGPRGMNSQNVVNISSKVGEKVKSDGRNTPPTFGAARHSGGNRADDHITRQRERENGVSKWLYKLHASQQDVSIMLHIIHSPSLHAGGNLDSTTLSVIVRHSVPDTDRTSRPSVLARLLSADVLKLEVPSASGDDSKRTLLPISLSLGSLGSSLLCLQITRLLVCETLFTWDASKVLLLQCDKFWVRDTLVGREKILVEGLGGIFTSELSRL